MRSYNISPPFMAIIPILGCVPILIQISKEVHMEGYKILYEFFSASLNPSFNPIVIESICNNLLITIYIAFVSWSISLILGTVLGVLSSKRFWEINELNSLIGIFIKRVLSIPRAIHEVLWGLLFLQIFGLNPLIAIAAIIIPFSAITSRVIAEQIDIIDSKYIISIKKTGANPNNIFLTSITPKIIPIILNYGSYRLECAIRSSTLIGIFGLGGIGNELQLTMQSLAFREMWTSLWALALMMIFLEKFLKSIKETNINNKFNKLKLLLIVIFSAFCYLAWINSFDIRSLSNIQISEVEIPKPLDLWDALIDLNIFKLTASTILISVLAASIGIAVPPLCLMLINNKPALFILDILWLFFRLIPPPMTALIILLFSNPSISVGALALGINNIGIMGRLLKEQINRSKNINFKPIKAIGSSKGISWLYGYFSEQSKSYLAFATYRLDVILRETSMLGAIGGIGLGWQLQESISSFNWAQVAIITCTFISITLIGEEISERLHSYCFAKSINQSIILST